MGGPRGGGGKGHKGQSHQSILTQATVYRLLKISKKRIIKWKKGNIYMYKYILSIKRAYVALFWMKR